MLAYVPSEGKLKQPEGEAWLDFPLATHKSFPLELREKRLSWLRDDGMPELVDWQRLQDLRDRMWDTVQNKSENPIEDRKPTLPGEEAHDAQHDLAKRQAISPFCALTQGGEGEAIFEDQPNDGGIELAGICVEDP